MLIVFNPFSSPKSCNFEEKFMPIYHKLGNIPPKRHTIFEKPGGGIHYEQLFGTVGFDGMASLLYHLQRPTQVRSINTPKNVMPAIAVERNLTARILKGFEVPAGGDIIASRHPLMINKDIHIGLAAPTESMHNYFYKNADCDELFFIHLGSGTLRTFLGNIPFEYGDYLIIPRGMIYQMEFATTDNKILYAESYHPIYTPRKYRNWFGQLLEQSDR